MNRKSPKQIWQEEAKRQGICIGIEKMRDAVKDYYDSVKGGRWITSISLDNLAGQLLAEQEEK